MAILFKIYELYINPILFLNKHPAEATGEAVRIPLYKRLKRDRVYKRIYRPYMPKLNYNR